MVLPALKVAVPLMFSVPLPRWPMLRLVTLPVPLIVTLALSLIVIVMFESDDPEKKNAPPVLIESDEVLLRVIEPLGLLPAAPSKPALRFPAVTMAALF